ncbi:hypothetical protein PpBr36_04024 [Pyricularia pennisetigena]|uniref:hypothetical protein n=1 Tax=Pyricularia pennisetigena TaxID=1578925 RepID=UPI001153105C|nr:hypothetical protein PpBr36_04024 [Pyricularia pennisetigena]TLS27067.1 hypothetical protein PpBr36_04024 [Pyricularia pennisetigena]
MQFLSTVLLGVAALGATVTAIPAELKARIPAGVSYKAIDPSEIPESVKLSATLSNSTQLDVRGLEKRADHGVFLCTDANWGGHCVHITSPAGVCVPLASDLNDQVSAVGPDAGGYCRFYFNAGCTDDNGCLHFDLTSPGIADLNQQQYWVCGQPANNPNDRVTSYQCWDQ